MLIATPPLQDRTPAVPRTVEQLLVVEDELHLAEVVADNLEAEGYLVEVESDGSRALERIRRDPPSLVLLDVMLPGLDGFSICERLRAQSVAVPILFMTARSSDDDRVRGLEAGGDDYLTKPFDLRELILRVAAILRRYRQRSEAGPGPADGLLRLGETEVDLRSFTVRSADRETELSTKETGILRFLAERAGEIVSRSEILDRVWGYDAFPSTRTIDNFVVRLRRLVEPDAQNPRYIHTIRGIGYRLTP